MIDRPNFTLTLLRTPNLPPTFASFYVPLNLHKLDLRDYLWNCYGVSVKSVRSYIMLQKLTHGKPWHLTTSPRQWHRPRSKKKMTVEMDKPFVWPAEPVDLEMWDKSVFEGTRKEREVYSKLHYPDKSKYKPRDEGSIASQAKELLKDPVQWTTGNANKWDNAGEEIEVETDIQVPNDERS
jgi:large subunit ribosomal protein L23